MGSVNYAWQTEQLHKLADGQPETVQGALEILWKERPDLLRLVVTNAYLDGAISLGKAAEELKMTRREFEIKLREKEIPVRSPDIKETQTEIENILQW